jgi:hypothetical protein
MKAYNYLVLIFALIVAGCATLEAPKTLQERILYTQYSLVAAVEVAADLRDQGKISQDDANSFAGVVTQADAALKVARGLNLQGKPQDALGYLETANGLLKQLEAYLRTKS